MRSERYPFWSPACAGVTIVIAACLKPQSRGCWVVARGRDTSQFTLNTSTIGLRGRFMRGGFQDLIHVRCKYQPYVFARAVSGISCASLRLSFGVRSRFLHLRDVLIRLCRARRRWASTLPRKCNFACHCHVFSDRPIGKYRCEYGRHGNAC